MYFYRNSTRYRAIVTILVQSTENSKEAMEVGKKAPRKCATEPGYTDLDVGPGESIVLLNNTQATITAIRNAP